MHLTRQTDYALRLLIALARQQGARVSIAEVAEAQAISRTHLMKVANQLARAGFIEAVRGRGGGIRLARPEAVINIGKVVATMEPGCAMIDCTGCRSVQDCALPGVLASAKSAFMAHLDGTTLADVLVAPPPRAGQ
ncbi:MAG: Rrf2 family transcriptional regulator [Sphingomonadales bacterium]|nr:Rrf2 family transcriptional regulator [Sphingomonadales bacterium]